VIYVLKQKENMTLSKRLAHCMYRKKICRNGGKNVIKFKMILEVEKLQAYRREKSLFIFKKQNDFPVDSFTLKPENLIFQRVLVNSAFHGLLTCLMMVPNKCQCCGAPW
jgi:hypothetical protein